jgi:hypothetical protein
MCQQERSVTSAGLLAAEDELAYPILDGDSR